MNYRTKQTLLGILAPNAFAMAVMATTKYAVNSNSNAETNFIFSEFFILPMLMGIISTWFWRNLELTRLRSTGYGCITISAAILFSYLIMGEGVICLVIVSPLILTFYIIGLCTGSALIKRDNEKLNVSFAVLLVVVFIMDTLSKHQYENEVSDTITINAPPAKVWNNVVAFKKIQQKPQFWLFRIGLPAPSQTTVEGYDKGANRKCIFSNGYTSDERISTYEPGRDLVFDITRQPRDHEPP